MKKIFLVAVVLTSLLVSCNALSKLTQFNIDHTEALTLPPNPFLDTVISISIPDIDLNSGSNFKSNNTNEDLIEEILITELKLNHLNTSAGSLSFLKSIEIFMKTDDLPEIKLAWKDNIDSNVGKELSLDLTDKDLKEYIKKQFIKVRIPVSADEVTTENQDLEINFNFLVDAKILGL